MVQKLDATRATGMAGRSPTAATQPSTEQGPHISMKTTSATRMSPVFSRCSQMFYPLGLRVCLHRSQPRWLKEQPSLIMQGRKARAPSRVK